MTEKELTDALNKALEPVSKAHQEFLVTIMDVVKDAFFVGFEAGQKVKSELDQDKV